jgi:hypothetical protein
LHHCRKLLRRDHLLSWKYPRKFGRLKKNVQICVTQLENDELKDSPVVEHAHEEGEEEDQGQHL